MNAPQPDAIPRVTPYDFYYTVEFVPLMVYS
jgi:hypothetical protein